MKDKQLFERQAIQLHDKFMHEIERLYRSGMISDDTSNSGIIRVPLENIAECYSKSHDHKNLKRI
jgi:hypothetical protein